MDVVYTSLILLLVVALSGVVLRLLPIKLPLPLVQIALGALLALPGLGIQVRLDPELFFLLFIPPLLYADGWRMPKRELVALRGPILALALGLVFCTVLFIGYLVHWMIPAVPLAVAFALASVLAPTDAVALTSITGAHPLPARLKHILEGEAMMNDASGLVSLQFAIAAALTGTFSLGDAALKFCFIALGGLIVGLAVTWGFHAVRRRLVRWSGEIDPPSHIALLLLLPFAAYLMAEYLGVSGILAAVAAGVAMNLRVVTRAPVLAVSTRMQSNSVWSMLEFVFNGIIFLLLGQQLPSILSDAQLDLQQAGAHSLWQLALYVLVIMVTLVLLRFAWVSLSLQLMRLWDRLRRRKPRVISNRLAWITSLAGVRGALTLAGILSLPLVLRSGDPFPARDLVIFLAASVIVCSLLLGSVALPRLLKGVQLTAGDEGANEERIAREALARAAVKAIQTHIDRSAQSGPHGLGSDAAARVGARLISVYQQRLSALAEDDDEQRQQARENRGAELALQQAALSAQREELTQLDRSRRIDETLLRALRRELDLAESALHSQRR